VFGGCSSHAHTGFFARKDRRKASEKAFSATPSCGRKAPRGVAADEVRNLWPSMPRVNTLVFRGQIPPASLFLAPKTSLKAARINSGAVLLAARPPAADCQPFYRCDGKFSACRAPVVASFPTCRAVPPVAASFLTCRVPPPPWRRVFQPCRVPPHRGGEFSNLPCPAPTVAASFPTCRVRALALPLTPSRI
jgi:hypothetical protein